MHTLKKENAELDNQWVVPYNRDLLVKYQFHMNIEICFHARSIKYLFKYCLKGHDTVIVQVTGRKRRRTTEVNDESIDEINQYLMVDMFVGLKQHIRFLHSQYIKGQFQQTLTISFSRIKEL